MDVLHPCCAGLDIHKKRVVACLLRSGEGGGKEAEVRTYGTTTPQLLSLLEWLQGAGCPIAVVESTGEYWKPLWNLFEGHLELGLVNARHVKAVPGRKTDVNDAQWLAELLRHGLVRPSFVPSRPQRELRELTRQRTHLVEERARVVNRLQQLLEGANIKLSSVLTDVTGVSGREMLRALAAGETDPEKMAGLARRSVRASREELVAALTGAMGAHQRFLLTEELTHLEFLEGRLAAYDQEIERRLAAADSDQGSGPAGEEEPPADKEGPADAECARSPVPKATGSVERGATLTYEEARRLLDPIPGIAQRAATTVLAEIGRRMEQFPSDGHLASWAGLAPGQNESAGKRRPAPVRPGNRALRQVLIQAAHGAARTKGSYFRALYQRLAHHRGKKRALVAVARSLLVVIYHVLKRREAYQELGEDYFERRAEQRRLARNIRELESRGYGIIPPSAQIPALA